MKKKIWTYSPFHSFKCKGKECTMQTQVYQIGIYVIYDNDSACQSTATPANIIRLQNKLRKAEKAMEITDLKFSAPIKVTIDDSGFYIQI